jgi:hypothetical protein
MRFSMGRTASNPTIMNVRAANIEGFVEAWLLLLQRQPQPK